MKNNIIFCLSLLFFASCKKHHENAYSFWHIGNDTFSTNNTVITVREHGMSMYVSLIGASWQFGFLFPYGSFADEDGTALKVVKFLSNPYSCSVDFAKGTIGYDPSVYSNSNIVVSLKEGKATWDMPDTWFVNTKNPKDSLLAGGHFSEP